ncbi:MAG: DUF3822 family protein [Flavobacteriales bacterium]
MRAFNVIYDENHISLLTKEDIFHYDIRSNTVPLIHEEIKSFLKDSSKSSFLHAPDFVHAVVGSNHLAIPNSVFAESNLTGYHSRMFGVLKPTHELRHALSSNTQVQLVHEQPRWLIEFVNSHFNGEPIRSVHSMLLDSLQRNTGYTIDLHCFYNLCYLGVYRDQKLWYSDFFEFTLIDDLIYMLINMLNQYKLDTKGARLRISSTHNSIQPEVINAYLERIEPLHLLAIETRDIRTLLEIYE